MPTFEEYKNTAEANWNLCKIREDGIAGAERCANKIIAAKDIYKKVEFATGVPWWWIGCIHSLEANFDFSSWLANGDPIDAPTVHVPAGLKCNGTWHDAAIVSLKHEGYSGLSDWNMLEICLYRAEKFNGWGYWNKDKPSQYLWSFTNMERPGRYVRDGVWDANAMSGQIGFCAILKKLIEKGAVSFDGTNTEPVAPKIQVGWFEIRYIPNVDKIGIIAKLENSDTNYESIECELPKEVDEYIEQMKKPQGFWAAVMAFLYALFKIYPTKPGAEIFVAPDNVFIKFGEIIKNFPLPKEIDAFRKKYPTAKTTVVARADKLWPGVIIPKKEPETPETPTLSDLERVLSLADSEGKKALYWDSQASEAEKYLRPYRQILGAPSGGFAWCGCFVAWCFEKAGLKIKFHSAVSGSDLTLAYVPEIKAWAKKAGVWSTTNPKRGDIIIFGVPGAEPHHVGFVSKISDGRIFCTEGNNSSKTIYQIDRTGYNIQGFIRCFSDDGKYKIIYGG